ncbi:MobC family replication-relaxation protein [Vibrio cincinnatiensis]
MRNRLDHAQRTARNEEKTRLVLRFLRDETWTHIDVIQQLLGIKTRSPVHGFLRKLEARELIKSEFFSVAYGRDIQIWGITPNGLAHSFDDGEEYKDRPTFSVKKVTQSTMQHKLDLQRLRVLCERCGFTNWRDGSQLGLRKSGFKVPDALVDMNGNTVAIEVERTIKTAKRYAEIIASHLRASRDRHWTKVFYFCPDEQTKKRLMNVFFSVKELKFEGQVFPLNSAHYDKFQFFTYEDLEV